MITAAAALACALTVLGRGSDMLPPIKLVDVAPSQASPNVEAFVLAGGDTIFILITTDVFGAVQVSHCDDRDAVRKLASIIVHEAWHVAHGADESRAYEAQLVALSRLGVPSSSSLYTGVMQSMRTVDRRSRRN